MKNAIVAEAEMARQGSITTNKARWVLVEGGSQDGLPAVEDPDGSPMARSPCGTSGAVPGPRTAYPLTAHPVPPPEAGP